jgi:hypothetical protein
MTEDKKNNKDQKPADAFTDLLKNIPARPSDLELPPNQAQIILKQPAESAKTLPKGTAFKLTDEHEVRRIRPIGAVLQNFDFIGANINQVLVPVGQIVPDGYALRILNASISGGVYQHTTAITGGRIDLLLTSDRRPLWGISIRIPYLAPFVANNPINFYNLNKEVPINVITPQNTRVQLGGQVVTAGGAAASRVRCRVVMQGEMIDDANEIYGRGNASLVNNTAADFGIVFQAYYLF